MKTLKEIHAEANNYSPDSEPLRDAFIAGARWMMTGRYYKISDLFNEHQAEGIEPIVEFVVPTFNEWWNAYGKKVGRKKAEAKWNKLSSNDKIACMDATPAYVESTADKQYRKDPLTYLNGECWNDEIILKQNHEQQRNIERAERAARLINSAYHQG